MAVFETWLSCDLKQPVQVKQLSGNLFSADNGGNKIGVVILDGGQAADVSGTVTGYVIREDGNTVVINGTLSGNRAHIVLTLSAYAVPGRVSIVIKLGTTTLAACTAYVYRTITDTIVDPAHVIPSLAELLAKIGDCETATTNANTKANLANEKATLADQKATLANNAATAANSAATKIDDMVIAVTSGGATQTPTATLTLENGHYKITFANLKGATGDGFHIVKTYASISAMEADFSGTDTHEGDFVMIVSTVEDPDNAKVYVKGASAWSFLVDMSGATGIQGQQAFLWIKYASAQPTQDSDMSDSPDKWMGVYSGTASTAPTTYTSYTWFKVKGETGTAGNGDMLAPDYDDLTFPVEKGLHCIYDDGYYVAKQRIESSEEWTAAHWQSVTVGDELTDLNSAIDRKADVVYDTIENTALAHFEDGADGLPVDELTVGIEPVQDLNGQEYPYPAGGSAQMIPDGTDTSNGYKNRYRLLSDGTEASNQATYISEYFPVTAGETYTVQQTGTLDTASLCFYNSSKEFISGEAFSQRTSFTVVAPTGAEYCRCTQRISEVAVQMEHGSTGTNIVPYSNICPITGWTGLNILRTDKNLLGGEVLKDSILVEMPSATVDTTAKTITFTGKTNGTESKSLSQWIRFKPGERYSFVMSGSGNKANIRWSYTDGTYDAATDVPSFGGVYVSAAGKNVRRLIKINNANTNTVLNYDECGIFEGVLTAADFTPYVGNKYAVSFGETPGTVYGGTLNVKTGVLTVDREMRTFDGTESWEAFSSGNSKYFALRVGALGYIDSDRALEQISNVYARSIVSADTTDVGFRIINSSSYNMSRLMVRPNNVSGMSASDFKTMLADWNTAGNPFQIVFPIATPVTCNLTPTEVRTLLGENNLWADTGNVSVTYPCDTKKYISKALSASQRIMELIVTANREDGMTASRAYSSGDLLIVNGTMYKASTSIASGATLTVGTNVTETTVAAELAALAE